MPLIQDTLFDSPRPTTRRHRRGTPWGKQKLSEPPITILRRIRKKVLEGTFSRAALDHNHHQYEPGLSNKQITILGTWLLGGTPNYDQCYDAVMEVLFGPPAS